MYWCTWVVYVLYRTRKVKRLGALASSQPCSSNFPLLHQFGVPVGDVNEVVPLLLRRDAEGQVQERRPLRLRRLPQQLHVSLLRSPVSLPGVTVDARAH